MWLEGAMDDDGSTDLEGASIPGQFRGLPSKQGATFGESYWPNIQEFRSTEGTSLLRSRIVETIDRCGFSRPSYNVTRNFEKYEDINKM